MPVARTVAMPFHPHGNTPQLYTRTRAREYTFSLLASSIVLNWEACTFKPHGCYLDRVLNDFSFAAHLDRHNYARPALTYSTDHTFLGWCPHVTHRVQENLPRHHYYYRGQNKMSRYLRSPWMLVIDVFKFPSWNSPQFERDNLDLLP